MLNANQLLEDIKNASNPLNLSELLALHPELTRRTAQRWIQQLIDSDQIISIGNGRARRYISATFTPTADTFPTDIPLSSDSLDILNYINQPVTQRKPVGYQLDFLMSYQPNKTYYLPEPVSFYIRVNTLVRWVIICGRCRLGCCGRVSSRSLALDNRIASTLSSCV